MHRSIQIFLLIVIGMVAPISLRAQESNLYTSYTTAQKRASLYQNLTKNIKKDLSLSVIPDHEDRWLSVFATLQLLQYKDSFVNRRIRNAFDSMQFMSPEFNRSLIQLGYSNYPGESKPQLLKFLKSTVDPELFAFASTYFIQNSPDSNIRKISEMLLQKFSGQLSDPVLLALQDHLKTVDLSPHLNTTQIRSLLQKDWLPGEIILYVLLRKDRDYPGIAFIRSGNGKLVRDSLNNIFTVPVLGRSISNMPYFLKFGNTPQGIYKMNGFGVSMSGFIGPTPNIQLQMPAEVSLQTFFRDSTILDSAWKPLFYQKLIPPVFREYKPIYESYMAGLAGRTEIIVHGTTINPDYYFGKPYFPHTPSEGCLTTSEIWNGKRIQSNQQLLINALLKAGGAHGYCIVLEMDDQQNPVLPANILPLIAIENQ